MFLLHPIRTDVLQAQSLPSSFDIHVKPYLRQRQSIWSYRDILAAHCPRLGLPSIFEALCFTCCINHRGAGQLHHYPPGMQSGNLIFLSMWALPYD